MLRAVIFDYGGVSRGDSREVWTAADATACLMIDDQAQHVGGARAAGLRAHLWTKPSHERTRLAELIAGLEVEGALP